MHFVLNICMLYKHKHIAQLHKGTAVKAVSIFGVMENLNVHPFLVFSCT